MAKDVNIQDTKLIVNKILKKAFNSTVARRITQAIEKEAYKIAYERLKKGIDVKGKRIKHLTPDYAYFKRRYVAGTLKHRAKSKTKRWYKELYNKTAFKAKGVPNYGFLRGLTFSRVNIRARIIDISDNGVIFNIITTLDSDALKVVKGLEAKGRYYYGALASPNTATGRRERERLAKIVGKYI